MTGTENLDQNQDLDKDCYYRNNVVDHRERQRKKILPLTIRRFRANQIAKAVTKVTMGYRLGVAALLEGKLHNVRVATLPCAWEFIYFTTQC